MAEIGALDRAFNVMGGALEQRRGEFAALADEQAALRRVATLVAQGASPPEVFAAVANALAQQFGADLTLVVRFEPDDTAVIVGGWSVHGTHIPIGERRTLAGEGVAVTVKKTGQPARTERFGGPPGSVADSFRLAGARHGVGSPILVEGVLWGVAIAAFGHDKPLAADSEARISGLTDLVATAISNAQAREELRRAADQQAALRRVATLVASAAQPAEVFGAVAEEVGRLLAVDLTFITRYGGSGDASTIIAAWGGRYMEWPIGIPVRLGGRNVVTLVHETRLPARVEHYGEDCGALGATVTALGVRSSVGAPITVAGRLWGAMIASSTRDEPPPPQTASRLLDFTELVAMAIANAEAHQELHRVAELQAALRRVATLVARGAPPEDLFAVVSEEVSRVVQVPLVSIAYFEADGSATERASFSERGAVFQVGRRWSLEGTNVLALVRASGRPARIDDYSALKGEIAEAVRSVGIRSTVATPIAVAGRVWGAMVVSSAELEPLAESTAARLASFTELVATAIANAEAQAELTASRTRVVATADETRRRIERDLHDGAQQRLVSLALQLRVAQATVPTDLGELARELDGVRAGLIGALDDLRELSHGIHPAVLEEGGLRSALKTLAQRSAVPVELHVRIEGRLPEPVEIGAYYVVSEALTNAAKHARATITAVDVEAGDDVLHVRVRDDGVGGADLSGGTGLVGLKDRVEALGGRIAIESAPGAGTRLSVELPLARDAAVSH